MNIIDIGSAMESACKYIPDGYQVVLRMEKGAAYVELDTPEGTQSVEDEDTIHETIWAAVAQALVEVEDI